MPFGHYTKNKNYPEPEDNACTTIKYKPITDGIVSMGSKIKVTTVRENVERHSDQDRFSKTSTMSARSSKSSKSSKSNALGNVKGNEREIGLALTKHELLRRNSEMRDKFFDEEFERLRIQFDVRWNNMPTSYGNLTDLERICTLGTGSFGTVLLMRDKRNHTYSAMKCLSKQQVVKECQIENTLNEKCLLQALSYPFIVSLRYHFKDNANLYLGMEFAQGGEMFMLLKNSGFFSKGQCKFYVAQIILAFEYLHFNKIIYRDLKPENVMICADGYIKLTDFGLAKRMKDDEYKAWTVCGTMEYLAPEALLGKHGYTSSVDWWALGVLIYEMLEGSTPFFDKVKSKIQENIITKEITYPKTFTKNLRDLLGILLERDTTKRYGALVRGAFGIMNMKWFKNINFVSIYHKEVEPTFIPILYDPTDTRYFTKLEEKPIPISGKDLHSVLFKDF